MKEGWKIKKMGKVYDVRDGTHDSPKYIKDGYPLITSKNLKNGVVNFDKVKFISELDYLNISKRSKVDIGDVLFAMIGTIGNPTVIVDEPTYAIKNVALFKVDSTQNSFYLKYYLESQAVIDKMFDEAKGSNQKFVGLGYLRNFPIPLPPLPEQHRIVSILDHCFEAIDKAKTNAEQNLQNAKELFESYLQGVFEKRGEGWEEKTLGALCKFNQGIQRGVELQTEVQKENQVRFLRIVDFTQGNEPPRYIDNPGTKYVLNEDDVSLVRYGASTGFVCRGIHGALANNMFRVIPNNLNELSNDFLYIYLLSPIFKNVIKKSMGGAAMPAISFGLIKNIPFPIPNLKEQERIAYQFELLQAETQNLLSHYQKRIDDLEELKKSILQKAFAGELKTEKMVEEIA